MLTFITIDKYRYETYDEDGRRLTESQIRWRGYEAMNSISGRVSCGVSDAMSNNTKGVMCRGSANRVAMTQASGRQEDY